MIKFRWLVCIAKLSYSSVDDHYSEDIEDGAHTSTKVSLPGDPVRGCSFVYRAKRNDKACFPTIEAHTLLCRTLSALPDDVFALSCVSAGTACCPTSMAATEPWSRRASFRLFPVPDRRSARDQDRRERFPRPSDKRGYCVTSWNAIPAAPRSL